MRVLIFLILSCPIVLCAQSVPNYIPNNGLVAWYPFNNNGLDASGNLNHSTVNGATYTSNRFGVADEAIQLDGLDDDVRLDLQSISNTFPSGSSFTINCWIKSNDNAGPITSFRGGVVVEFAVGTLADIVQSPGKVGALIRDDATCCGAGNNFFSSATLTDDWSMITLIRRGDLGGVLQIYQNGILIGSSQAGQNGDITPLPSKMSIGSEQEWIQTAAGCGSCNTPNDRYLAATIDDFLIYNRALTELELEALYNAPPPNLGCTDINACNYDSEAIVDDGSCLTYINVATIDTTAYFPDSLVLQLVDGYDVYTWSDGWGDAARPVLTAQSYILNAISYPTIEQITELQMVNIAPQTAYQGSWGNVAHTNSELLRTSSTGEWTFSAWVKLDDGDNNHSIIGKDLWWGNGYHIYIQDSQLHSAFMSTENYHLVRTAGTVTNSTYHHIAVTHSGQIRKHFVDGVEVGSWTEPSTFNFSDAYVGIGFCASNFDCTFNGRLDELMVWHRAIAPEEMQDLMQCPEQVDATGLIAFWDFENADGGPESDKSGNGITLTWVNSPTIESDSRTVKCNPFCESYTYNLNVLQPHCHDETACNYQGLLGYSAPDSCSFLQILDVAVQAAPEPKGLGALYLKVSGGSEPYEVTEINSNASIPVDTWVNRMPGQQALIANDANGCELKSVRFVSIPHKKCQ